MRIYCATCMGLVDARLTNGKEIYPHRPDLYDLPFWKCDVCKNYVGCHHKTEDRTRPLGVIPNKELRWLRMEIHAKLDTLWKSGQYKRKEVYQILTNKLGWKYHTAKIRNVEEGQKVLSIVEGIK